MLVMKVVYVYPDMNDNTMALPELILPLLNADFEGDVLNIHSLKIDDIKNEYYEKLNPMYNVFISRNDGKYNMATTLCKDMSIGLYTFANI